MSRLRALALLVGVVVLCGCGSSGTTSEAASPSAPSSSPLASPAVSPTSSSPSPAPVGIPRLSWRHPVTSRVGEWTLAACSGDAPLVCVRRGRREAGSIELLQYPVASLTAAAAALRSGGPEAALRAHAEDFLRSLAADRKAGCGADYQLTPLPFEILRPADGPVLHYGFVAGRPGGPVLERVEHFEGLRAADKVLVLVHASATAVAGCLDREGEFLPADLSALAPVLTALVVRNGLPTPLAG